MLYFFTGLFILFFGYLFYGKFIEKIVAPTSAQTPAYYKQDGVDFLPLPRWKNMMIQLLNIAGIGPVIGVIIGIKFGEIVFLIMPIGNIIGGATHDYLSGMMSLRRGGANLPILVRENLGKSFYKVFTVFSILILLLVVAVFVNIPSHLLASNFMMPLSMRLDDTFPILAELEEINYFWVAVVLIFGYYIIATLFPVDKIIGKIYPIFGAILIVSSIALLLAICYLLFEKPEILSETPAFAAMKWTEANGHPVIPLLFVTIACGIISGFHATQSPIVARTMKSEREGRATFYGIMVVEGLIGMIWAARGLAIYNMMPDLFSVKETTVLIKITRYFLGSWMGIFTVVGVIILAITSGDTAMRALRLSVAEILKVSQVSFINRVLVCVPIILVALSLLIWSNLSKESFAQLWNYFAWANQVLAASTLFACSAWLFKSKKNGFVALIPAMFMCFIVSSYILYIPNSRGGFGLDLHLSYFLASILTLVIASVVRKKSIKHLELNKD